MQLHPQENNDINLVVLLFLYNNHYKGFVFALVFFFDIHIKNNKYFKYIYIQYIQCIIVYLRQCQYPDTFSMFLLSVHCSPPFRSSERLIATLSNILIPCLDVLSWLPSLKYSYVVKICFLGQFMKKETRNYYHLHYLSIFA